MYFMRSTLCTHMRKTVLALLALPHRITGAFGIAGMSGVSSPLLFLLGDIAADADTHVPLLLAPRVRFFPRTRATTLWSGTARTDGATPNITILSAGGYANVAVLDDPPPSDPIWVEMLLPIG